MSLQAARMTRKIARILFPLPLAVGLVLLTGLSHATAQTPPPEERDRLPGVSPGPTRAGIEEAIRQIGRDPVTPELVDRIDSLFRPRWASQRRFEDFKKKLLDKDAIARIDAVALDATQKPADTRALVFRLVSVDGEGLESIREGFRDDRDRENGTWKTIKGRVFKEGPGGEPVAGAVVSGSSGTMTRTDSHGRFTFKARATKSDSALIVYVEAPGLALTQTCFNWADLPDTETIDLAIPDATSFTGRVLDEKEKPIADAELELWMRAESVNRDGSMRKANVATTSILKVRTDAEGRYAFRGVPPDLPDRQAAISLTVTHPKFLPRQKQYAPNELLGPGWEITLETGCVLKGVVMDDRGQPVANARVQASFSPSITTFPATTTDSEGRFRFENLPATIVTVVVGPETHLVTNKSATTKRDQPVEMEIRAKVGQYITGRVVGEDGKPIAGATLGWLKPVEGGAPAAAGDSPAYRFTQSKDDGTFRLGPLEKGRYEVTALNDPPRVTGKAVGEAGGEPITVVLKPGGR